MVVRRLIMGPDAPTSGPMRLPSTRATLAAGSVACLSLPVLEESTRLSLGLVIAFVCTGLAGLGLHKNIDRAHRRVWLFLYIGLVSLVVGVVVRVVHAEVSGDPFPFPSPADIFTMAGYLCILRGQLALAKARRHENNRADLLDALLLGALVGIPFWAMGVAPFLLDSRLPVQVRTLDGVYSLITIALVVATALLAVGPGKRNPSYYLLAASMFILFVIDTGAILDDMGYSQLVWVISYAFPAAFIAYAAAALHPDIARLTDRPELQDPRLTRRRLAILVAAVLVVPSLLMVQVLNDHHLETVLTSLGSALIALLVLARMTDLVRVHERSVVMERVRSATAERLVSASETEEITRALLTGMLRLAEQTRIQRGFVLLRKDEAFEITSTAGWAHPDAELPREGDRVGLSLGDAVELSLAKGETCRVDAEVEVVDKKLVFVPSASETIVIPLIVSGELRGAAAITVTGHIDRATERVMDSVAWEASLALQSSELRRDLARQQTERRYRAMFENSSDLVCVVDVEGRIIFSSPTSLRVLGIASEQLFDSTLMKVVHERDRPKLISLLRETAQGRERAEATEMRMRHAETGYRWFEVTARDLRQEAEILGLVLTARDVTDRRVAEQQLASSEARFRSLVQNSSDIVAVLDSRSIFTYVSPAVTGVLGYRPDELVGTRMFSLLPNDREMERSYEQLCDTSEFSQTRVEIQVEDRYSRIHTLDVTLTDLRTEPSVDGIVLNARDISDNRELEQNLQHQAMHDSLTGLTNREGFSAIVAEALARDRPQNGAVAVLLIDIDDFKTVNDSMGHDAGDRLLVVLAERIQNCLRLSDSGARVGGDEFAVLLEPASAEGEVVAIAERILEASREPVALDGRDISVTASIGLARNTEPRSTSPVLIRNADTAMNIAKQSGKNQVKLFETEMHTVVSERLEIKAALARAISGGELVLYYQPIVSMDGRRIHGAEALVRWRHPTRGVIGPGAFISIAEETGLVVPMGSWILNEAVRQLGMWQKRGLVDHGFTLDVNLSALQLREADVVGDIVGALARNRVAPASLAMEITESLAVDDSEKTRERLDQIRQLGVQLALDDFGTGFSSLGYIHRFPVDIIKIDRSFVAGLGTRDTDATVARTIINLAGQVGARTVAEGIETERELAMLTDLGCDLAQGFLFARPVPSAEFAGLLTGGDLGPERSEPESDTRVVVA